MFNVQTWLQKMRKINMKIQQADLLSLHLLTLGGTFHTTHSNLMATAWNFWYHWKPSTSLLEINIKLWISSVLKKNNMSFKEGGNAQSIRWRDWCSKLKALRTCFLYLLRNIANKYIYVFEVCFCICNSFNDEYLILLRNTTDLRSSFQDSRLKK